MKRLLSLALIAALLLACAPIMPICVQTRAANEGPLDEMIRWSLSADGTLTISSLWGGEMKDYASASATPWYNRCDEIKKVVIKDTVYSIGNYAFAGCKNLTEITVAESVARIGSYAFSGCESLKSVVLPEAVGVIEEGTFSGCRSLTDVALHENITGIGYSAFAGCESLTAISIPVGFRSVAYSVFSGCDSLESVFYAGTEAQKALINIGSDNDAFTQARWHCEVTELSGQGETVYLCGDCGLRYHKNGAAVSLKKLTVITKPDKLSYLVGESLCLDGLSLEAVYDDGTAVFLGASELEDVTANLATAGKKNAVVSLGGLSAQIAIVVHDAQTVTPDASAYPESDHEYGNSLDETKTFAYPGAVSLAITFSWQTNVEADYDYIYIYDGADNKIASYTGTEAAGQTLTVPGDTFKVRLTSDAATTGYGYAFDSVVACTSLIHVPVTDPATFSCTQAGLSEGSHCEICDLILVEQVPVDALGHDYSATFNWSKDHSSCKAVLTCKRQCGVRTTLNCQVNVEASEPGVDVYTAVVECDGQEFTDAYVHDFRCSVIGAIICDSLGESYADIYVKLMKDGVEIASMVATDALYRFDYLVPGDYTVVVSRKNYATVSVDITLTQGTLIEPVTLHVLGDLTHDGRVNIADVSKLYGYIKGDYTLEEVDSGCDLTGDGKLTVLDVVMIYAHVKGNKPLF